MEVSTELARRLMEIGLLAANRAGLQKQAHPIFAGLRAARPQSELPLVGHGVAFLNTDNPREAGASFEAALQINPENDIAKCYLGMAYQAIGWSAKSRKILADVIENGDDPEAASMARNFMNLGIGH